MQNCTKFSAPLHSTRIAESHGTAQVFGRGGQGVHLRRNGHDRRRGQRQLFHRSRRNLRDHGAVRLGQIHHRQNAQPAHRTHGRQGAGGRQECRRDGREGTGQVSAAQHEHGVSVLRPDAPPVGHRQRGFRSGTCQSRRKNDTRGPRTPSIRSAWPVGRNRIPVSFPAACSSAWDWPGGLAVDPDILLMDEAFSALDPLIRTEMQDELLKLQEEHQRTIVFISHDLDEALRIGDRIAIMEGGRVIQVGAPGGDSSKSRRRLRAGLFPGRRPHQRDLFRRYSSGTPIPPSS
jgi:hypothetical protein